MLKRIAVIGVTAAAIVGTGAAALAATGSSNSASPAASTAATSSTSSPAVPGAAAKVRVRAALARLKNLDHATWVTDDKTGQVTHQAIRGKVDAVSSSAITVTSAGKTTQTYVVNSSTKVHTRDTHKGAAITDVKVGDNVVVSGDGASAPVANQIVDITKS